MNKINFAKIESNDHDLNSEIGHQTNLKHLWMNFVKFMTQSKLRINIASF